MTRRVYIERARREVYGGFIPDDAEITENLVNVYIGEGLAVAVKQLYKEAIALDGVAYVNSAFYITYKNLSITSDSDFVWKVTLPAVPIGLGRNEGVSALVFKDSSGVLSETALPLTEEQWNYHKKLRTPPNSIFYKQESNSLLVKTPLPLFKYKAQVTMVSGGNTDLDADLNAPDEALAIMDGYVSGKLKAERLTPKDNNNDSIDIP